MNKSYKTKHDILHYYYLRDKLKYDEAEQLFNESLKNNSLFEKNLLVLTAEGELQTIEFLNIIQTTKETRKVNPIKMEEYKKYELKKPDGEKAYLTEKYLNKINEPLKWYQKPVVSDIIKGLITFAFTMLGAWLLSKHKDQSKDQLYKELQQQVKVVNLKVDSLTNLQKHIKDSVK
jgi:hypothetical protein